MKHRYQVGDELWVVGVPTNARYADVIIGRKARIEQVGEIRYAHPWYFVFMMIEANDPHSVQWMRLPEWCLRPELVWKASDPYWFLRWGNVAPGIELFSAQGVPQIRRKIPS